MNFKNIEFKEILSSYFFRGLGIISNLLLVRYSVEYLGESLYGIWLAMFSFFSWFSFIQMGISNSHRSLITEGFLFKDFEKTRSVIAQGYFSLSIIFIPLSLSIWGLTHIFPITKILLPSGIHLENINTIFGSSLILYFLHYVFFHLNHVLISSNNAKFTYLILAIQNGVLVIILIILREYGNSSNFLLYCLLCSGGPFLTWFFFNIFFFKSKLFQIRPNFKSLNLKSSRLGGINKDFFLMQASILVLFSTDNIIIVNFLGSDEVTTYHIVYKYFNILIVFFNVILVPYWTAFTEATLKGNFLWIQKRIKKLIIILALLLVVGIGMISISETVYQFWIGKPLSPPLLLSIFTLLMLLGHSWNNIFAYYLNSVNKTKWQKKLLITGAIANIPISILFLDYFGVSGIVIATCLCLLPMSIYLPLHYLKDISLKKLR